MHVRTVLVISVLTTLVIAGPVHVGLMNRDSYPRGWEVVDHPAVVPVAVAAQDPLVVELLVPAQAVVLPQVMEVVPKG